MKLLDGIIVLDFAQYLAGPWAATKLADLGARVIKIERPQGGDNSRRLTLCNLVVDGDSTVFHSQNRNKESYTADLKKPEDMRKVKKLIEQADVMIQNFRPGVMEKIGLGYDAVHKLNPRMIYASVTGYGDEGPLTRKPGQDLLVQAMSGIPWLSGNEGEAPVPIGVAAVDMFTTMNVVEGVLAALFAREKTGKGALIQASLLESSIDFQFEVMTTYLNNGNQLQPRCAVSNAHPYLGAPYGIYQTKDGYMAVSMGSVTVLGELLDCPSLIEYTNPQEWYSKRDEIKQKLAEHLLTETTGYWLDILEPADFWAARVNTIADVAANEELRHADMIQEIVRRNGVKLKTTRSPLRVNGEKLFSSKGAPVLGEDTDRIDVEFGLLEGTMV